MFVFVFFVTYFHTEYFFDVLGLRYRFDDVSLYFDSEMVGPDEATAAGDYKKVPPGMYLNAVAFFVVYHAIAIVCMRRVRSMTLGWGTAARRAAWPRRIFLQPGDAELEEPRPPTRRFLHADAQQLGDLFVLLTFGGEQHNARSLDHARRQRTSAAALLQCLALFFRSGIIDMFTTTHVVYGFFNGSTNDPSLAQQVAQAVFVINGRKHEKFTGYILIIAFLCQFVSDIE